MKYKFEEDSKKPLVKKILKEILIWLVEIAIVVGLAYFLVNYAIERTTMVGDSMKNTLQNNDRIIINKVAYRFSKPKRFDVVVFKQRDDEHSYLNIKRIIGLPGETVQIMNGAVYINGSEIQEPIVTEIMNNSGLAKEKIKLEENEYFVLGDNRNNSEDSRFANIGNILFDDIVGKAWIRTNNFNFVNKINLKEEVK
jgi:signal peptidase I, bacterial type